MNLDSFKNQQLDPYQIFFCVIGGILLSLLLGVIGIIMVNDTEHGNPLIIYPLATLFAVAMMMNMGDQNPSAKEVFWGWVVITFGLAALSGIGVGIMYIYKLCVS